jgi:hypothetical protein
MDKRDGFGCSRIEIGGAVDSMLTDREEGAPIAEIVAGLIATEVKPPSVAHRSAIHPRHL